eukprot:4631929-Prymnesium_polylepis.1
MAAELGMAGDAVHWNATVDMPHRLRWYDWGWERAEPNWFGNNARTVTTKQPSGHYANWGQFVSIGTFDYPRDRALATTR